ncbi:Nucleoside diphosphate kinase 7 [Entophlyctis sp. JEL0112]|nr:Nucleoside diphosphate kinase 7 [Entophlyctis sp. JEL0112]
MSALERMCFLVEWFDVHAQLSRQYQLFFYETDNSIEMVSSYDPKQRRTFLKRTKTPDLMLKDFHIGAAVNVYSRQLSIVDYGDEFTRSKLSQAMESALVIIKPDAIEKAGEIIDALVSNNFVLCKLRMLSVTRSLAEELCMPTVGTQPFFNDVVVSLEGHRALAMEVMKSSACTSLSTLSGPELVAEARANAPGSLRAKFGTSGYKNGIYTSTDTGAAKRELAAVFPPAGSGSKVGQRTASFKGSTLAIIRPHAVHAGLTGKIMASIVQNGYKITDAEIFSLDRVNAEEFLEVYKTVVPEYQKIVDQLTSGPLVALEISGGPASANGENIVSSFRELAGPVDPELAKKLRPKSLRAMYGLDKIKNAIHCTDLEEDGPLEVQFFFRIMANSV